MERRLVSIESLADHHNAEVGQTFTRLASDIRSGIDRMRQAEQKEDREWDQRFE